MNNKNRKNWKFYETRVEKKRKGEERPHNVPNEIMVQRMSANPSGRLKKYEPLDLSCQLETLKNLVNVSTICLKTLGML